MKDILKKINKKEKIIIGVTLGVILVTLISTMIKDTHAFYNSETTPIQIFKAKIGNFKPIINSFYIKDTNTPKYTNQNINTVYLSWGNNNKNINEMCITEGDINSCNWKTISNNTQYTFATETEGTKIIKGYVKDKAGNKSLEKSDTIIYDKTAPTINKVEATNIENSITISVTPDEDLSGVIEYCYAQAQSGPYTCKSESTNQYTGLEGGTEYTFWIYLKDRAGNGIQNNATQYKFKTKEKLAKDYLDEKGGDTFILKSGMYRFVGTSSQVTNNYICFGTTDLTTCKNTPGTYMYRIIGVTSSDDNALGLKANQLKLIKAIPSSTSQKWHNNARPGATWDDSDIKEYLNTTFLNDAVSKWENGETWKGLITSQRWYNKDQSTRPTASTEPTTSQTVFSQIGLMYGTDYMNTNGQSTSNWLFIKNGWTGNSSTAEWTMSRCGGGAYSDYKAWCVDIDGYLYNYSLNAPEVVRPVFYLTPGIKLTGEGTVENPFIIHS